MNPVEFQNAKKNRPLSVVTCYDYTFARLVSQTSIDAVLVGDSSAMVMAGHKDTLQSTVEDICFFTSSVAKGLKDKLLIADMPFLSFRKSLDHGMDVAAALIRSGAHAVKVEGVRGHESLISHLVQSGIPVMGHLGLTPQHVHGLGGYKVQGKTEASSTVIQKDAELLEKLGVFSVVLECVPSSLARTITEQLNVPTIGIGAGPDTDGQVLVLQDLLGLNLDFKPKFVRPFLKGAELVTEALEEFHQKTISRDFPSVEESFR